MGIGLEIAKVLAHRHKCYLTIVDLRRDLFDETQRILNSLGSVCTLLYCDLSDPHSLDNLIATLQKMPKIDLLVNNAGITLHKFAMDTTLKEQHRIFAVNYFAPVRLVSELAPQLKAGHVGMVASMMSIIQGGLKVATYSATKHALYGFTSSLRQELKQAKQGPTLTLICPYAVSTTMFAGFRTRLKWLLPILNPLYVARRSVAAFEARQ